jgi:hypothetical protein
MKLAVQVDRVLRTIMTCQFGSNVVVAAVAIKFDELFVVVVVVRGHKYVLDILKTSRKVLVE